MKQPTCPYCGSTRVEVQFRKRSTEAALGACGTAAVFIMAAFPCCGIPALIAWSAVAPFLKGEWLPSWMERVCRDCGSVLPR
jgi:hypothetical protein